MTEREALRLLHLDEGCSRDQLRSAYLDMVKVWHPDRFQADAHLRAKAERTLQSINDAYALLQARPASNGSPAASADGGKTERPGPRADSTRQESRARPGVQPLTPTPTLSRHLLVAAAAGTGVGVILAVMTIARWNVEPEPPTLASTVAAETPAPPAPADIPLNSARRPRPAAGAPVDAARPESGHDLLSARGRGTGQLSARNATAWDAAVLLDGPSGTRAFFVRRGEQVTLLDVAPGTYGIRVMFGATWTGRVFAQGATFFQREEPVRIAGPAEAAGARAPLIVLERAGMRLVEPFRFE